MGAVASPDFKSARGALPMEAVEPVRGMGRKLSMLLDLDRL